MAAEVLWWVRLKDGDVTCCEIGTAGHKHREERPAEFTPYDSMEAALVAAGHRKVAKAIAAPAVTMPPEVEQLTGSALTGKAKELEIEGRGSMRAQELREAIAKALAERA